MRKRVGVLLPVFVTLLLIVFFVVQVVLGNSMERFLSDEVQDVAESVEQSLAVYEAVVKANNQFAFDLYEGLHEQEGNIFFSPFSVANVLAMTYEGARGETADEIRSVSYFPSTLSALRVGFSRLYDDLDSGDDYELRVANSLWVEQGYPIMKDFFTAVRDLYRGEVQTADFTNSSSDAIDSINTWTADRTGGKVLNIIGRDSVNNLTRLVLVNAMYFKGAWSEAFEKALTRYEEFMVNGSQPVQVPMMRRTGRYPYTETDTYQVLEIPYRGGRVSMVVFLPKEGDVNSVEQLLETEDLVFWKNGLYESEVLVAMPKFTLQQNYPMVDVLRNMGVVSAFDAQQADFSGISAREDLFISGISHEAVIEVSEEGTEAAAATSAGFGTTSVGTPPKLFRVDRPFMFLIQDNESESILFMGRVMDPQG